MYPTLRYSAAFCFASDCDHPIGFPSCRDVAQNRLESLPTTIGGLRKLRYIDATDNLLTSLPASLGNLPELRYVNLENNLLEALPASLGNCRTLRS